MIGLDAVERGFLNFRGHAFAERGAHAYRWVDTKVFRCPAGEPDEALLAALVAHPWFRDDYAGGDVDPDGTRHGPYRLDAVTAGAYRPVEAEEARRVLRDWADEHGPVPASLEAELAAVFAVVASADRCYRLADLGDGALHDWGGVHCQFHEFVAVDRGRARLTLLVAADD
ncbi:hypothetical protein [Streptomyces sp. NPDC126499]|uniref:hypothetical protein n=1 Tax=Streptomyces sp. NPDC126499 TaxID=3155314 RepID=UPI00333327AF